jgi:uncharacterized protein YecT (DUF1311 family)
MRAAIAALVLALTACAGLSFAQPVHVPDGTPLWRIHTEHLAADRRVAHACLVSGEHCEVLIHDACVSAFDEDSRVPALDRQCDWRAIAAWEDEMNAILADLRSKLSGDNLRNLNASQEAWDRSMLADVGLGMDYYTGGSIAGPIGAHIRARATVQRAVYLHEIQQMVNE